MDLFVEKGGRVISSILVQPGVAGIANNLEEPSARIAAVKTVKKLEGTQVGLLYHVLRIFGIAGYPTRQVVGGVQMRQNRFLKSHPVGLLVHGELATANLQFARR
jgi:hypothetical protein